MSCIRARACSASDRSRASGARGYEGLHLAGVAGDQGEPVTAPPLLPIRTRARRDRLQYPAHVIGQQVRLGVLVAVVDRAAGEARGS